MSLFQSCSSLGCTLFVFCVCVLSLVYGSTCPRVNADVDASHHRHRPQSHRKSVSVLHGDLKSLYYGEVCVSCLRDGVHRRPLVAVPDVDAFTGEDIVDSDAVKEAPDVSFEVVDRHLVSIEVSVTQRYLKHSNRQYQSDNHMEDIRLPPFRILISDGESDETPLSEQLIILDSRSNHTFLDRSVTFGVRQLALMHLEPMKMFYIRLDTYSRRLTSFEGAFWLPQAATSSARQSASLSSHDQSAKREMSFSVVPPVPSGTLGTRFRCTLSFYGSSADHVKEIRLNVTALRKAPVPPQRVQVFVIEVPSDRVSLSSEQLWGHIVIENDRKDFLLSSFETRASLDKESRIRIYEIGVAAESHVPSVRSGLQVSESWSDEAASNVLRQRLWLYLNEVGERTSPPMYRYGIVVQCTSEELSREYHEEFVVPQVGSLLQRLRGLDTHARASERYHDGPGRIPHIHLQETMIAPISYLRFLQLEQFQIQQDGSSLIPPDEPFLRILFRHEPDHNAIALFLVQPVPIRNLQIFVVNGYNETELLEESYEVPFVGPDRDIRAHPLFGVRRFLSDERTWIGGDELRIHIFFDLRDAPPSLAAAGEVCHSSFPIDSVVDNIADDSFLKLTALIDHHKQSSGKPTSGHSLISARREYLQPAYFRRASQHIGLWHHHAVREDYERGKAREALLHLVEQAEGHIEAGVTVVAVNGDTSFASDDGSWQLRVNADVQPSMSQSPIVLISIPMDLALTSKTAQRLPLLAPLFALDDWKSLAVKWNADEHYNHNLVWNRKRMREGLDIALVTFCGGDDLASGVQHHAWLTVLEDDTHAWARRRSSTTFDNVVVLLHAHRLEQIAFIMKSRRQFIERAYELIVETFPWLRRQRGLTEQAWFDRVTAIDAWSIDRVAKLDLEGKFDGEQDFLATELFVAPLLSWCTHSNTPSVVVTLNMTRRMIEVAVAPILGEQNPHHGAFDLACDWTINSAAETTVSQFLRFQTVFSDSIAPIVDVTILLPSAANEGASLSSESQRMRKVFWLTVDDLTRNDLMEWIKREYCGASRQPKAKLDRKWRQPVTSENDVARCALRRTIKLLERRTSELPLIPLSNSELIMANHMRRGVARILNGAHLVLSLHLHHLQEQLGPLS